MASVAFDTLKLAQRLEAAGFPAKQAQDMASAIADTIVDTVVTQEYFDLRLGEIRGEIGTVRGEIGELRAATARDIAEAKADMLKWMFGAVGLQTLAILGGVAALLKLIGH
jgi:hypothetical protein